MDSNALLKQMQELSERERRVIGSWLKRKPAALQAPVIMMSQNRQASKDRLEAHYDYEVNTKTKIDKLRDAQWAELIALQQRQVELLEEIRGGRPERS